MTAIQKRAQSKIGLNHRTAFDWIVEFIVLLISLVLIYPFLNIIATSMSSYQAYVRNPAMVIPSDLDLSAYRAILSSNLIFNCYVNTVFVTVVSTVLGMILNMLMAYPLSHSDLAGKKTIMSLLIFTMMFNGGLIANFFLIVQLGLYNSLWALIVPGCLSVYNIILMKNFFEALPNSVEEAARIDGANDIQLLVRIVLPMSMPIIATLTLFYAVSHWNAYFNAVVYITDRTKWTLQLLLRETIMAENSRLLEGEAAMTTNITTRSLKSATLVVTALPIIMVYPFLQKYFVKGIMMGAVKQ
mgnify:CR=1 FL=1